MFKQIKSTRIADRIYDQILQLIIDKKIKPGEKLPPEKEMVTQMKCSRSALREALKMLENSGILNVKKGAYGGYIVNENNVGNVAKTINLMYQMGNVTTLELLQVRKVIEISCVEHAMNRITPDDINELAKNVDELYKNYDNYQFLAKNNREFHLLIASFSGNKLLKLLCETLMDAIDASVYKLVKNEAKGYQLYLSHKNILEAFKTKNKEKALQTMNAHLDAIKVNWESHKGNE